MNSLAVVFFGTPAFAVPTLDAIAESRHRLVGVVTQPDRPRGRGQRLVPGPVKARAVALGIPVHQPTRLRDPDVLASLAALGADIGVVAAYGRLLPQALLDQPRLGMINVHASLLPRWRGAAPVHRAVLAGDRETGVSIMRVVLALDAGPVLATTRVPIGPDETSAALETRLATLGAPLLVATLDRLAEGPVPEVPQDETRVTYAQRLDRGERQVEWERPATEVHNRIRGLQPWPLATARLHGQRLALLASEVVDDDAAGQEPGTITRADTAGLVVATGSGSLRITQVKPEGRGAMPVSAFLNGHPVAGGDRFEPLPASP